MLIARHENLNDAFIWNRTTCRLVDVETERGVQMIGDANER
jgi:hypothetical protein